MPSLIIESPSQLFTVMAAAFPGKMSQNMAAKAVYLYSWEQNKYDLEELKSAVFELIHGSDWMPTIAQINQKMKSKHMEQKLVKRPIDDIPVDPEHEQKLKAIIESTFKRDINF